MLDSEWLGYQAARHGLLYSNQAGIEATSVSKLALEQCHNVTVEQLEAII